MKGTEMNAGHLYVSDRNLEERFNFKISITLGKSVNAIMCNALGSIYISCTEIKWYNGSNSFERMCKTVTEAFSQKCANPTKMLKSAEPCLFRHSARIIM